MSLPHDVVDCTILTIVPPTLQAALWDIVSARYPRVRLQTACSGREGFETFNREEPSLVVLDLQASGGVEFAEQMTKVAPETAIIVFADERVSTPLVRCIRLGISRVVMHPVEDDAVVAALDASLEHITLRRRLKENRDALHTKQARYQALFEKSLDGLLVISENGSILEANAAACAMLGRRREDLCLTRWQDLVTPASCPSAGICQHAGSHNNRRECRVMRNDDRTVFVEASTATFDGADVDGRSIIVLRDMTDCRNTQKSLNVREQRLRHALDSAKLGCWEYVLGSGEVFLDDRCRAIFGLTSGAPLDYTTLLHCLHPADRANVHQGVKRAIAGADGGSYRQEHRIILQSGEMRWVELHGRMYCGDEAEEKGSRLVGIAVDVTERVRSREALRESEARYRRLFGSLQEGFSLHEAVVGSAALEYPFIEANPALEKMVGIGRNELIGRSIVEIYPECSDALLRRLDEVTKSGTPLTLECTAWHRHLRLQLYSPVRGQIAILYSDVTERRKLQEEREKSERLESLGVLAGGIAHDFNNILTAIAGNMTLARLKLESGDDPTERLLESETAIAKAAGLTRQLLTFAQGGEPIKKPLHSEPLIREALSLFVGGTNCQAEVHLSPDLWLLDADAGQIQQVLNNLALNAVQAMPAGGTITVRAHNERVERWGSVPPGAYLSVSITDQGVGIAAELLPRIFDPYFTTKPAGSGLGLASVFSIVKRHGGAITVSSEPGRGTTFQMLLPALVPTGDEEEFRPRLTIAAAGREVLVMDDEEPVRGVACALLEGLGFAVTPCSDGSEAIALYREKRAEGAAFAAVLLDMTVPGGIGGKEAALQIRQIDPEAVIIICSGYFSEAMSEWQSDVAVNGVVAKPYTMDQLSEELSQALRLT